MRRSLALPTELVDLAAARHAVVTTGEVRGAGLDSAAQCRRVDAGLLESVGRGVIVVPQVRDRFTDLVAIQVRWPNIVGERRTGAGVWGLDGFNDDPLPLDLVLHGSTRPPEARHLPPLRIAALPDRAIRIVEGIRVTSPGWTLAEVGTCDGVDADRVELALECALFRRLTTEDVLRHAVDIRAGAGAATLATALSRRRPGDPPTESYAETRFLQRIVRPLGLEDPERQVVVPLPGRRHPYRCDFVFRRARPLDVEIDGRDTHDGDRDAIRDHHIEQVGWEVARFSAWRIERRRTEVCTRLIAELDEVSR